MNISFDVKRIDDSLEKRKYMPLLLLADEQQSMIYRYLDSGTMYVMTNEKGDTVAQCVVAHDHGSKTAEIKSISVASEYQRRGYGKKLVGYIENVYRRSCDTLKVGTGDSPLTVPFYLSCGFVRAGVVKNFFTDNYDHPIYECGVQLKDMVYFEKKQ